jgi:hypothetical protein
MRIGMKDDLRPIVGTVMKKKFKIPVVTMNPPLTTIRININPFFRMGTSSLD